ncbi:MAG: hypothetical protein K6F64_09680 [Clostridia bacterium]|nr:hypothetical protein [Clostridia bacterium]
MEGNNNYEVNDNRIPDSVMNEFVADMMAGISAFYEKQENKEGFKEWEKTLLANKAIQ